MQQHNDTAIEALTAAIAAKEEEIARLKDALSILQPSKGKKATRKKTTAKAVSATRKRRRKDAPKPGSLAERVLEHLQTYELPFTRQQVCNDLPDINPSSVGSCMTGLKQNKKLLHVDYDTSGERPLELYRLA